MSQKKENKRIDNDQIFVVIYYFIVLFVLGLLYYFVPILRLVLIVLIAGASGIFIVSFVSSIISILVRRHRVMTRWAERKLINTTPEEKEITDKESGGTISYAEKEIKSGICGKCGGKLVLRITKYGAYKGRKFYGCKNFPKCKNLIPVREVPRQVLKIPENAPVCSKCGSKMVLRTARQGQYKGRQFYGCSKYPECKNIVNI